MKSYLLCLTDTHCGHRYGLLPPDTVLEDEYTEDGQQRKFKPELTDFQLHLWYGVWIPALEATARITRDAPVVVIHDGDVCQGTRFIENLQFARQGWQVQAAGGILRSAFDMLDVSEIFVLYGTNAHSFGEGSAEEEFCTLLRETYEAKASVAPHNLIDVSGMMVDAAHHGPAAGSRQWLLGNAARGYLMDRMMAELDQLGQEPARLYLRGHKHQFVQERYYLWRRNRRYKSEICVLPSLCGPGEHSDKASQSATVIWNGVMLYEIIDGDISRSFPFMQVRDIRQKRAATICQTTP